MVFFFFFFAIEGTVHAEPSQKNGIKGVFIDTVSDSRTVGRIGIQLFRDNLPKQVPLSHTFRTGDQIQFVVTPNVDGFLYIFTEAPSAEPVLLWPRRSAVTNQKYIDSHAVRANQTYFIPEYPKIIKFDKEIGKEIFYAIISSKETPPLLFAPTVEKNTKRLLVEKDVEGNQIVQFRVNAKGLEPSGKDEGGYIGMMYVPTQNENDHFVYFSAYDKAHKDFAMIRFQLKHE